jgi:hypothetical protein
MSTASQVKNLFPPKHAVYGDYTRIQKPYAWRSRLLGQRPMNLWVTSSQPSKPSSFKRVAHVDEELHRMILLALGARLELATCRLTAGRSAD